jgi:hypothetical protein
MPNGIVEIKKFQPEHLHGQRINYCRMDGGTEERGLKAWQIGAIKAIRCEQGMRIWVVIGAEEIPLNQEEADAIEQVFELNLIR